MGIKYTAQQLADMKDAVASGISKIRDGEEWVEFQSINQMRKVIADAEEDLKISTRPKGTRLLKYSSGRR